MVVVVVEWFVGSAFGACFCVHVVLSVFGSTDIPLVQVPSGMYPVVTVDYVSNGIRKRIRLYSLGFSRCIRACRDTFGFFAIFDVSGVFSTVQSGIFIPP